MEEEADIMVQNLGTERHWKIGYDNVAMLTSVYFIQAISSLVCRLAKEKQRYQMISTNP